MNTFNKASKITVTILLLALALSLGACSSSQNSVSPKDDSVTSSPISESETLPAAESQQGGNLSLITDPYGGIFRNGAGTSFGYYEIMSAQNNSLNILYTDYATDIRTYLCADPDCTHNSDTCTSWFSFLGSAYPFTSADGSKIYLVTTGYADNAGSISDEQNYGTIYQFDANGANRKVLYRLQSNEEFYGTAASDGEKLYVSIQVVDSNTSSSHWEVRCLDLSNGESSVIYTTDQYGERIFGAYANNLVIEEVTDTNRSYYAYAHNLTVYLHEIEEREGITILGQINDSLIDDNSPAPSGGFGNPFNDPNWEQHITSFFGKREDVGIPGKDTTNHNGLDIAYPYGTPILAVEAGTVIKAGYHVSYGNYLVINHGGGYCTLYAHCSQLLAQVGDTVNKYDTIAKVGATGDVTGNHLHICVIIDGVYVNPKGYLH